MTDITYKPLSGLFPIEFKYQYSREEELNVKSVNYKEGLSINFLEGLNDFKDSTINKNSGLLLTNTIYLSSLFKQIEYKSSINRYPSSLKLFLRSDSNKFIFHNSEENLLKSGTTDYSVFYLKPLKKTQQVEIFVNGKFLQIKNDYPYNAYLQEESLDPEEIERQRFIVGYQDNCITFKVLTSSGYRYLGLGADNVLRATGTVLNNVVINDYIFNCEIITSDKTTLGFIPSNNWVGYFSDNQNAENKTVNIDKNDPNILTNFLIDFPIEKTTTYGIGYINVANLKTNVSPIGHPSPII